MLTDDGVRLVKLFFHITPEEQLARFEERLRNPMKRWKLSYEDFRNRRRWNEYKEAISEMFEKTSTSHAPWHLIAANNKRYARIAAMKHIVRTFSHGVDLSPPALDGAVIAEAKEHFELKPSLIESLAGRTE
jgi:polyphosphate kinase 2 (PPK2 family)